MFTRMDGINIPVLVNITVNKTYRMRSKRLQTHSAILEASKGSLIEGLLRVPPIRNRVLVNQSKTYKTNFMIGQTMVSSD